MKKVLFSALAVMAVGATAFGAYQTNNEKYVSTLFLDSVEALADNGEMAKEGCEQHSDPCTVTCDDGSIQPDTNYWFEGSGDDEGCIEFCICDDCSH